MPIYKGTLRTGAAYKGSTSLSRIYKGSYLVFEAFKTLIAEGVPPIILLNCAAEIMLGYKIYGNSVQGELPDGYTQLECIESSGTQYINTGVVYDSTKKYTIFQDIEGVGTQSVKGSGWNSGGAIFLNNTNEWYDGNLGNTGFSGNERVKVTIDIDKNSDTDTTYTWYSVNSGTTFTNTRGHTTLGVYASSTGYPLLTSTNNSGVVDTTRNMSAKLYGASISVDDTLVRNLIPAKNSSNVVGMYDTVNNVFYTNAGTGTFTAGPTATVPTPDNPVEIQSVGDKTKNLWNSTLRGGCMKFADGQYLNYSGYVCNTTPIPVEAGETYTLSANNYDDPDLTSSGFVFYNDGSFVSSLITTSFTVTIPSGVNQLYYNFRKQSDPSSLDPSDITNVQLEKGSSATSYEPYGYRIPVKNASPNLLPYPYILNSGTQGGIEVTINDDGSIKLNGTSTGVNANINTFRLKAGTYTISGNPSPNVKLWLRVVGSMSSADYVSNYNGIKGTLTIAEDSDMYVYITVSNRVTLDNVTIYPMVNEGKTDLEYSKYFAPETTNIYLDEPLRKIGNYIDYIDFETGKVYRNVKKINLSTTLPQFNFSTSWDNEDYTTCYFRATDIGFSGIMSNYFKSGISYQSNVYDNQIVANYGNTYIYIKIAKAIATSKTELNNWLNTLSTPVEIIYQLASTTEESIELPDILLNKGTNVISVGTTMTPSNMWIKYKGRE